MDFGQRIRDVRKDARMTQEQVAQKLNVSKTVSCKELILHRLINLKQNNTIGYPYGVIFSEASALLHHSRLLTQTFRITICRKLQEIGISSFTQLNFIPHRI